jgi:hypothetical protein
MAGAFESERKEIHADWWEPDEMAIIRRYDTGQLDWLGPKITEIREQGKELSKSQLSKVAALLLKAGLIFLSRAAPDADDVAFIVKEIRQFSVRDME